jgi:hypothetical protein
MKDLIGTILVAAIAVPYIGYLVRGEMPFVKDPRGMSATGLILGGVAFLVLRYGDAVDAAGRFEIGLGLASLALGLDPGRVGGRRAPAGGVHGLDPAGVGR